MLTKIFKRVVFRILIGMTVLGVTVFTSCSSPVSPEQEPVEFEVIMESSYFFKNSNLRTVVLQSDQEEETFLTDVPQYQDNTFPSVDYDQYTVIGILLGQRGVGNTRIRIDSVAILNQKLHVYSTEILPGARETLIGYPATMVKIQKRGLPVTFEKIAYKEE